MSIGQSPPEPVALSRNAATKALFEAARNGDIERARKMLALGADPSLLEGHDTPLSIAIGTDQIALARLLLEAGANVNGRDGDGTPVLALASEYGVPEMVRMLLEAGGDPRGLDRDGRTAIHRAALRGDAPIVQQLVARGGDVNVKDHDGCAAIHPAACWGNTDAIAVLLEAGAHVNSTELGGLTALIWAAKGGHRALVSLLLSHGASPNLADDGGWTPLHHAAQFGALSIVRELVGRGADPTPKALSGQTARDIATAMVGVDIEARLRAEAKKWDVPGKTIKVDWVDNDDGTRTATVTRIDENGFVMASESMATGHAQIAELLKSSSG